MIQDRETARERERDRWFVSKALHSPKYHLRDWWRVEGDTSVNQIVIIKESKRTKREQTKEQTQEKIQSTSLIISSTHLLNMQPFLLQSFSQPLLIICWGVPRKYTSSYHPLCEFLSISRHSKLFVGRERERDFIREVYHDVLFISLQIISEKFLLIHMLWSVLWLLKLPQQHYSLLETPFILALCACITNISSVQLLSVFTIKFQSFIKICVNNSEPL